MGWLWCWQIHPLTQLENPFLKSLCPLPSSVPPLLRYCRQFPPPMQIPPALIRPTNLSWWFEQMTNIKYLRRNYQFNCWFLSKINFNLLNPFTNNRLSWFMFGSFLDYSELSFHKIMVTEKNNFFCIPQFCKG